MAINDTLNKIKKRAVALGEKSDRFNSTIEQVERGLLGSGVEFWWTRGRLLGLEETREELAPGVGAAAPTRRYFHLGYAKFNGDWLLAVQPWMGRESTRDVYTQWEDWPAADAVPLKRAPRIIRIAAAEYLDEFLEALYEELGRMEAAVDKANSLISPDDDSGPAPLTKAGYNAISDADRKMVRDFVEVAKARK